MFQLCRVVAVAAAVLLAAGVAAAQDTAGTAEERAAAAFTRNDCAAALPLYQSALDPARAAHDFARLGLFYRRIGICYNRMGDPESALAAYRDGAAAAEATTDIDLQEEDIHGMQVALQRLSRFRESLAEARRELALAEKCGHPMHLVRALLAMGNVERGLGQTGLAEQYYQRILDYSRPIGYNDGIRIGLSSLSQIATHNGNPESALPYLREVLALAPADSATEQVLSHNNLGDALEAMGRLPEALAEYQAAFRFAQAPEAWTGRQIVLLNLGHVHHTLKQYDQARHEYEEALASARQHKDADNECLTGVFLSDNFLDAGDGAAAETAAREAVGIARRLATPSRLSESLSQLGKTLDATGQAAEAGAVLEEAAGVIETLRAAAPGDPQALQNVLRNGFPVYQLLVKHLLGRQLNEEAFRWAEQAKARVLNDVLLSAGVDERRVMTAEEIRQESLLYRKVSQAAADRARSQAAIGELEFYRRQLYAKHPELALQRADFAPASVTQLKTLLPDSRTALLDYFLLPGGLALFIVRDTGIQVVRLHSGETALADETGRFRRQLAARDVNYQVDAKDLYAKLLAPAAAALRGTDKWTISPDGPLWDLPFQALMDGQGRHLLESHTLSFAPSLTALWQIRQRETPRAAAPLELMAMGNPTGTGVALPEAEREVRRIGELYPTAKTVVLTGADARQDRFREQASRAAVIHLATHGVLNDANPLYSYLMLSPGKSPEDDGMLTANEILRMPLHARLAILSACETARGKAGRGEGMLGMGWALAAAGVPASVLSQWKVDSAATEDLMVAFHRSLRRVAVSDATALQHAALEVMQQPGHRNPFYWAGFIVLGDGLR
jgi:CHAT domain-containing protein